MLPFEIVVIGTPIARQGSADARKRWQSEIKAIARKVWPESEIPNLEPIAFRLAYFYVYAQVADLDNIVKTAQDALEKSCTWMIVKSWISWQVHDPSRAITE